MLRAEFWYGQALEGTIVFALEKHTQSRRHGGFRKICGDGSGIGKNHHNLGESLHLFSKIGDDVCLKSARRGIHSRKLQESVYGVAFHPFPKTSLPSGFPSKIN